MSVFTKLAASIFAPQDAGGTPLGVVNGEAQTWGTELERIIDAAVAAGNFLLYETKAALDADLAHDANTAALVVGDSTSNDGLYVKSGASGAGSWSRVGDVPGYSFIRATDAGGSANAIAATTVLPINESQLIVLPINLTNTGTPVTVSFNGGSALTIKTSAGNNPAIGGLVSGTVVAGYKDGSNFQMLSDQASTAIQAAAEAAQTAAEAARDAAFAAVPPTQFGTIALAKAVTIPGGVNYVETLNRGTADGGTDTDDVLIRWKREASAPSHGRYFLDDSSAVFSIITRVPDLFKFGGTTSGTPAGANGDALQAGLSYCDGRGLGTLEIPSGDIVFDAHPGDVSTYGKNVHLKGAGMNLTRVFKTFAEATDTKGLFHWVDGSPHLSGMTITAATGGSGGAAFAVVPTTTAHAPGFGRFEELYITSGPLDGWAFPFIVDGQLNNTDPRGVRDIALDQIYAFGSTYGPRIVSVTNFSWKHGFVAVETGAGNASGNLTMLGVSGAQPNSGLNISLQYLAGTLVLGGYNQNGVIQSGRFGGISNTANETNIIVIGSSATPAQTNWPSNCRHISSFAREETIRGKQAGVGAGGTPISFGRTFATAPGIQLTVEAGAATAYYDSLTTTGCTIYATAAGQIVSWQATGSLAD